MVPTSNIPKNAKEQRTAESNNVLSELQTTNQLLATLVHRVEKTERRVEMVDMTINSSLSIVAVGAVAVAVSERKQSIYP